MMRRQITVGFDNEIDVHEVAEVLKKFFGEALVGQGILKMDFHKGVFTSATKNERGTMSNDHNWIHDIIPRTQVEAMDKSGDAMVDNMKMVSTNG
jgi:hypothetical protein